jgi:tetratricopeptide (TPR) repeat protein
LIASQWSSWHKSQTMGKSKLKQQLKRPQRDVLAAAKPSKKQKKQKKESSDNEMEVEIESLAFDDAVSAGLAFEQLESFDGALAAFQRAVECQPAHLEALTHLADVHSAAGQKEEALKCYVKASDLEGGAKDASVWFRLGLAYAALEQQQKATMAYKKAMEINAEALEAINEGEAEEEDVVELRKAYGVTLAALAEAFGELRDLNAAVKVFEDATNRFPDSANLHYNLANMRMARSGSMEEDKFDEETARSLERAVELSPNTRDFVEDLAAYLEQHSQQPERVRELKAKAEELQSAEAAGDGESEQEESGSSEEEEDASGEEEDEGEDGEEED